MTIARQPHVSFVLATHNRRTVAAGTLSRLVACGLERSDFEIIVIDNASTDGTPEAIRGQCDVLVKLTRNAGSCAKADGIARARGRYLVFLDDDSYPREGSVRRMIERFEADPQLGAAGFTIHLPDGRMEGGALPDVFVGCGVGFRTEALRAVGGLDRSFFMQAEEYDLAFRLVNAGWRVRVFDDLHVEHLKTPNARRSERTTFYDIRNNLRVAARYLPDATCRLYRDDWLSRYAWLAIADAHIGSFLQGALSGMLRGRRERITYRRRRLTNATFEHFFRWAFVQQRMDELAAAGVHNIVLADLGKNVLAYYRAAIKAGVNVLAIGDDRFSGPDRCYRGIPVLPLTEALDTSPDAVVVANMSTVHGAATQRRLMNVGGQPVYHWFGLAHQAADRREVGAVAAESRDGTPALATAVTR